MASISKIKIGTEVRDIHAVQLTNERKITLSGSVTGTGYFDGSGDLTITTSTNHTHNYAGSSSAGGGAKKNESYQVGSVTTTYGNQWQVINQWITNDRLKIQVLNDGTVQSSYPIEVNHAYKLVDSSTDYNKTTALLNKGSATQPVYFSEGVPVACTYSVNATVPANAKFTDTVYTHPTTSGNKHIPAGGSSGQILRWSADGTAVWGSDNNTNYYHTPVYSTGLKIGTGSGVSDMYVPNATGTQSGVVIMHPAANCTTFTSDDSTCTVAAVKKAVTLFTNDYAPTKTGGGASGTWGISITGNAATATKVANALSVNGKTYDGSAAVNVGTIGLAYGGTGATTAVNARVNLISLSNNPITKVADDTVAKWGAYGPGATAFYSATGQLTDQPSQWGFIQNIMTTTGAELHQIWATQASGDMYHRGGNASGWSGTWRKFLDSTNYNTYSPTLTGGGASGTWGINITGSAGSVAWNNITGKPSSFAPDLPRRLQNYSTSGYASIDEATEQGFHYITGATSRPSFSTNNATDYRVLTTAYSSTWLQQIATDFRCNDIFYRRRENGTWKSWVQIQTTESADARYAKLASPNNLVHSSNEITMVPDAYSGDVYLNYRTASGNTNGAINTYRFCKGNGGDLANITASSFIGSLSGNASTATRLQTARTIKIGESTQNFDGSANLTYTPFGMRLTQAHYGVYSSMNAIADTGNALGMANLTSGNSTIDPNGGTGWHHYINMTWSDTAQNNGSTTNEWCTQIANPCGSTDLWVRSRSGGSIADGTAWGAPWTRILTGSNYTNVLDGRYVNTSGDTMTGALNFANGTWNNVGDDCALGDYNQAGAIGIKGLNGATGIYFVPYSGSVAQKITIDGAGTMSITGKVSTETLQLIQNGVTSTIGSQNSGWLHYNTNSPSGHWFNQNVSVQGNIYAGSNYNKLVLTEENYTNYAPTKTGGGASGTWPISISGKANNSDWLNANSTLQYGASGLNYFNISGTAGSAANANQTPTADWYHIIRMNHANSNGYYTDIASCFHNNNMYMKRVASGSSSGWLHIWVEGNSVTSAVWNDYAECRESDCEEFGYVLMEVGDDSLTKTTERLSHFAGVSSDTWGFSQGETEKAKTPIAVAGRVLVYPYQDRNNYKPGDCVCAASGGTVDIMTREEVREWPDRIVGTVSCVPDYEEWGGGEGADRDPVKVNGRIWIKVK